MNPFYTYNKIIEINPKAKIRAFKECAGQFSWQFEAVVAEEWIELLYSMGFILILKDSKYAFVINKEDNSELHNSIFSAAAHKLEETA